MVKITLDCVLVPKIFCFFMIIVLWVVCTVYSGSGVESSRQRMMLAQSPADEKDINIQY